MSTDAADVAALLPTRPSAHGGAAPGGLDGVLRSVDEDLVRVCHTFVALQKARHRADYDRDYAVHQQIALDAVADARQALDALWRLYADGDPNTVLLLRLTLGGTRIARSRA